MKSGFSQGAFIGSALFIALAAGCGDKQNANKPAQAPEASNAASEEQGLQLKNASSNALAALAAQGHLLTKVPDQKFTPRDVIVDADGTEHVRFERTFKGLKVIGGDLVTHKSKDDFSVTLNNKEGDKLRGPGGSTQLSTSDGVSVIVDTTPKYSALNAKDEAKKRFKGTLNRIGEPELVITSHNRPPTLAWQVSLFGIKEGKSPSNVHVFIDANSGEFLDAWEKIHRVQAIGKGFHSGEVKFESQLRNGFYNLLDETRGGTAAGLFVTDIFGSPQPAVVPFQGKSNVFGNFLPENVSTIAADVHFGATASWDYFLKAHGRKGYKNDGKGIHSHFGLPGYAKAYFWEGCECLVYGNGDNQSFKAFTSLDIAVHEFSHAVTNYSAGLIYEGESGGLNEATSDIFASLAEFYFNLPSDPPDYLVGEKVVVPGVLPNNALRFMHKPSLDGVSPDCYSDSVRTMDVHYSSGIANHFFYLLAEGSKPSGSLPPSPTCNSSSITGIGREKAGKIWYRALTVYMTSSTNYSKAKLSTLKAARDLYGANSKEVNTVGEVWAAVSVPNKAPVLNPFEAQKIKSKDVLRIPFKVVDSDSELDCATAVKVTSSNEKVLKSSQLRVSGKAPNCSLTTQTDKGIRPTGTTQITISVQDERTSAKQSFSLSVVK